LPPPAAFDDARYSALAGNFDKIDQKHHHKNEKADHHSMLEYGDNLHSLKPVTGIVMLFYEPIYEHMPII